MYERMERNERWLGTQVPKFVGILYARAERGTSLPRLLARPETGVSQQQRSTAQ